MSSLKLSTLYSQISNRRSYSLVAETMGFDLNNGTLTVKEVEVHYYCLTPFLKYDLSQNLKFESDELYSYFRIILENSSFRDGYPFVNFSLLSHNS